MFLNEFPSIQQPQMRCGPPVRCLPRYSYSDTRNAELLIDGMSPEQRQSESLLNLTSKYLKFLLQLTDLRFEVSDFFDEFVIA